VDIFSEILNISPVHIQTRQTSHSASALGPSASMMDSYPVRLDIQLFSLILSVHQIAVASRLHLNSITPAA
jgi:hypothetical protein